MINSRIIDVGRPVMLWVLAALVYSFTARESVPVVQKAIIKRAREFRRREDSHLLFRYHGRTVGLLHR